MAKVFKRYVTVVFIICIIAFAVWFYFYETGSYNEPPVIEFDVDSITASVSDDESVLLSGVSAHDKEDGDMTDKIIIEGFSNFINKGKCYITYAVADSGNKVGKAERVLEYTDYTPPRFSLSCPLVFPYGTRFNLYDYITAYDLISGDISSNIKIKLPDSTSSVYNIGIHQIDVSVTNNMGDKSELTLNVYVVQYSTSDFSQDIEIGLSDYLIYTDVDNIPDYSDFITEITAGSEKLLLTPSRIADVKITAPQINKAGVYEVNYVYTSENGKSGSSTLIIIAEE